MINQFSSHASHPTVKTPWHINFCCSCLRVDRVGAWRALLRLLLLSSLMFAPGVVFVFGLLSCLSVQLPQAHSYPTNLPKFIWKLNWTCDNPGAVWKKRKTSKKSRRMFYLCCVFTNGTVITVDYRGFLPQTLSWEDSSKYWWVLYGVASMLFFCHFYCWVLCGAYAKP